MLNQLTVIGNVGKDPESGTTKKGGTYTRFRLAVDQGKDEEALWLSVVCWGSLAKKVFPRLHKGSSVFVQGRLHMQAYTDKNDVERQGIELIASNIQVLEKQPIEIQDAPSEPTEKAA